MTRVIAKCGHEVTATTSDDGEFLDVPDSCALCDEMAEISAPPVPMTAYEFECSEEWSDMCKAGHPTDWYSFAEAYANYRMSSFVAEKFSNEL